jgi:dihydropteroate synthase
VGEGRSDSDFFADPHAKNLNLLHFTMNTATANQTDVSSASVFRQRFPSRAQRWQLRSMELCFGDLPSLMGIINVTPDSFSDGGHFLEPRAAIEQGRKLVEQGAAILDIGGESTRPYSCPVDAAEELRRVLPVVQALCEQTPVPVSIDTSKAKVAAEALAAGAQIINDVTGLQGDPAMIGVAVEAQAGVCVMHMQGTPQTMQDDPQYRNVVQDIHDYLFRRRDHLVQQGLDAARICLDPGIGFGKTHEHNLTLLSQCGQYHRLACPLLVGHSRKGFIARELGDKAADRTAATIGVSLALARQGVQILRVHEVLAIKQALRLFYVSGGIGPVAGPRLRWEAAVREAGDGL